MSQIQKPKAQELRLRFGAMTPKLRDQIADAGFMAFYGDVAEWQVDADAISRLMIRGLLTDSETAAARKRLLKIIAGGIAPK